MFYKLRDFISSKLYSLAHFINPLPTLDEVLGEPVSYMDDDKIEWQLITFWGDSTNYVLR